MTQIQTLNSNTYALAVTSTSDEITLTDADAQNNANSKWIIYNAGEVDVFVVGGLNSPTAAIPASATVPVEGKIIPAGQTLSFDRSKNHKFLAAVTSTTATIYVSVGAGE